MSILRGEKEERKSRSWIGKVDNTKSTVHMNTTGIFPMNINEYNYINGKKTKMKPKQTQTQNQPKSKNPKNSCQGGQWWQVPLPRAVATAPLLPARSGPAHPGGPGTLKREGPLVPSLFSPTRGQGRDLPESCSLSGTLIT